MSVDDEVCARQSVCVRVCVCMSVSLCALSWAYSGERGKVEQIHISSYMCICVHIYRYVYTVTARAGGAGYRHAIETGREYVPIESIELLDDLRRNTCVNLLALGARSTCAEVKNVRCCLYENTCKNE